MANSKKIVKFISSSLVVLGFVSSAHASFRGWNFGMTKEQVMKVKDCKPYTPVKVTGGLECKNFSFREEKINISFVFERNKLAKIQLWEYMGKDQAKAIKRWHGLLSYLRKTHGDVESPTLKNPGKMSSKRLTQEVQKALAEGGQVTKLQFKPKKPPGDVFIFGSFIYSKRLKQYFIFLYFQPPKSMA